MDGVVEELLRRFIARHHGHGSVWMGHAGWQLSFLGFGVIGTWVSGVTWHVIWPRGYPERPPSTARLSSNRVQMPIHTHAAASAEGNPRVSHQFFPCVRWEIALHRFGLPIQIRTQQMACALHETGIRLLLEHGAFPLQRDAAGTTPLQCAAMGQNLGIFRLYLSACAHQFGAATRSEG